jgi:hypothetical protein
VEHSGVRPGPNVRLAMETGGWIAGLSGAACLAIVLALWIFRGRIHTRLMESLQFLPPGPRTRIDKFLEAFDSGMESTRRPGSVAALLSYTAGEWILVAAAFFAVFRAFPTFADLGVADVLIALGFVLFGSVIQIPAIGGGMQVTTVLILTELYGFGLEASSGVALVLWVVNFLIIVPLGLAMGFHEGIKWRNMKHVGEDLENLNV